MQIDEIDEINDKQLTLEINHILDSGANDIRLKEMFYRHFNIISKNNPGSVEKMKEQTWDDCVKMVLVVQKFASIDHLQEALDYIKSLYFNPPKTLTT